MPELQIIFGVGIIITKLLSFFDARAAVRKSFQLLIFKCFLK